MRAILLLVLFTLAVNTFANNSELESTTISKKDSIHLNYLVSSLKGIEYYASYENYYLLAGIYRFKGDDSTSNEILKILDPDNSKPYNTYNIEKIDAKSGFISYTTFLGDSFGSITYWNLSDGSKLVGKVENVGQTVSESIISFKKHTISGVVSLENSQAIPDFSKLENTLINKCKTDNVPYDEDILEFKFFLPQKGKNIQYCHYSKEACLTLKFNDGTFILN